MESYKKFIGKKLRNRRKELGLTQEALGALIDTDQSRIARWERGENIPDPKYRKSLVEHLKTDENIFNAVEIRNPNPQALTPETLEAIREATKEAIKETLASSSNQADDPKAELFTLISGLSPEMIRDLTDIVRGFVESTTDNSQVTRSPHSRSK